MTTPSRDDNVTTTACPVCGVDFRPIRRQRYCTPVCRQAAYRRRQPVPAAVVAPAPARRRELTVYTCAECEQRYLGQQWCPDRQRPCTRTGIGGLCPNCDEPVALDDLLSQHNAAAKITHYAQPRCTIEAGSQ